MSTPPKPRASSSRRCPTSAQFAGKSIVVKLGGAAIDREPDLALAQDVLLLRSVGVRCVLVHGGGPQVDAMLRRVGKEPEFRDGLRVTDAETLEIVRMVLVGKINRDLVATINSQAGDEPVAVGVSGEDAGLLTVDAGRFGSRLRRQRHPGPRRAAPPPARRRPDPGRLDGRRGRRRPALQRQCRRGGAGDRGGDEGREDRLSDRRAGPARGCQATRARSSRA